MKNRGIANYLKSRHESPWGRLIALTGARQSGKTTLARSLYPGYAYISFDDPAARAGLANLSAHDWIARYPHAILDEVQKMPQIMDTIKAVHDQSDSTRLIMLGSSQILLMDKIKESLAGRVRLIDLYPLTLPELGTEGWESPVLKSRFVRFLENTTGLQDAFAGVPALSELYARYRLLWERGLEIGFMPILWKEDGMPEEDARDWLVDYTKTYLQRDVRDLVMLRDLEPFVLAQQAVAARTGCIINTSKLARTAAVSPSTAQRFLRYLEISFQTVPLQPWFRNLSKRLVKSPKLHMMDIGVMRAITGKWQGISGSEFESSVVVEIFKQIQNAQLNTRLYHLRTAEGREIDLLIELEQGYVAVEIKSAQQVRLEDVRSLRGLEEILDKPLLASLILSNDQQPRALSPSIWALPVAWALSPADNQFV